MPRLRHVSVTDPGLSRRRTRGAFVFLAADGSRITDPEVIDRCAGLAIPPAWTDVWICASPSGHLQAFGRDDAGRGQYIYHPQWAAKRARAKHDHVLEVATRLPAARQKVAQDLDLPGMPPARVHALAFRLLDVGYFRIGSEAYAERNSSFGLATLLREHVTARRDGTVRFRFPAKSGQEWDLRIEDPQVHAAVRTLLSRRGGERLLAWRATGRPVAWHQVTSAEISASLKERLGTDVTAKDFRTWHATVLAARLLAEAGDAPSSARARRRVVTDMVRGVAQELRNTPAVARSAYINPRLVDLWEHGMHIPQAQSRADAETAVLTLLADEAPREPRRTAPTRRVRAS